jgi:CubicO group peptidase (beta-lactamase class C family)
MTDLATLKLQRRVQQVLAPWRGDGPGMTIGVVRGGVLAVHESAGLAHVELGVPIGAGTTFRIASVSKQFTCAAVLMMAADGRLRVDADVREYIPELADFGAVITVDHLMRNTSGLRDMLEIMRMGGIDLSFPVSPEDLMAGICRQRTLNFAPGSRYLYSNTNFLLLGRIVERVSGEKLRDVLAKRVFAPVGMNMTRMVESTTELVPGLAAGYLPEGAGIKRAQHGFPLHGEGALVSSVLDLALWARSYDGGLAGSLALQEQAAFTGGGLGGYARGLAVASVRGVRTVGHGGLWPGYRTEFLMIPELEAAVIVIANSGTANPYQAGQAVLAGLLEEVPSAHPVRAMPDLAGYAGRFVDDAAPASVDISVADGVLTAMTNGQPFGVLAEADGRLAASRSARDWVMRLEGDVLEVELDAGVRATYRRVAGGAALPEGLAGTYVSDEMDATWIVGARDVAVRGPVGRGGPWGLEGIDGDVFRIWTPGALFKGWLDARVVRDAGGAVTGLYVNGGRVKRLVLRRVG